jgi:hypothetical protein
VLVTRPQGTTARKRIDQRWQVRKSEEHSLAQLPSVRLISDSAHASVAVGLFA